jgi:hypothetical protein
MPLPLPRALALALSLLALSCAAPARVAAPAAAPPDPRLDRYPAAVRAAIRERRVVRGMDAEAVRLAWGEPAAVERTPSLAAPGLLYERWSYGAGPGGPARAVWLADGRVVDVAEMPGATAP